MFFFISLQWIISNDSSAFLQSLKPFPKGNFSCSQSLKTSNNCRHDLLQHYPVTSQKISAKLKQEQINARVMRNRGTLIKTHAAEKVNQSFAERFKNSKHPFQEPFKKQSVVYELESNEHINDLNLVRVSGEKNIPSQWVTEKMQIAGKNPQEIKSTLNLPKTPSLISDTKPKVKTRMLFGYVEPASNSTSHEPPAIQYYLVNKEDVHPEMFQNTRPILKEK